MREKARVCARAHAGRRRVAVTVNVVVDSTVFIAEAETPTIDTEINSQELNISIFNENEH